MYLNTFHATGLFLSPHEKITKPEVFCSQGHRKRPKDNKNQHYNVFTFSMLSLFNSNQKPFLMLIMIGLLFTGFLKNTILKVSVSFWENSQENSITFVKDQKQSPGGVL